MITRTQLWVVVSSSPSKEGQDLLQHVGDRQQLSHPGIALSRHLPLEATALNTAGTGAPMGRERHDDVQTPRGRDCFTSVLR